MVDGGRAPGAAQRQVPVLGAVRRGVKAACVVDQGAPVHGVHQQVGGQHQIGGEVRLEPGMLAHGAVGGELVLVEVHDAGARLPVEHGSHFIERVGGKGVVVIQQGHEVAGCHIQSRV